MKELSFISPLSKTNFQIFYFISSHWTATFNISNLCIQFKQFMETGVAI